MRVLVTGHRGYIGSVLTTVLRNGRFDVVGLDTDLYGDCNFGRTFDDTPAFDIDIRDVEFTDLLSFDAVVHLAALPEDEGRLNGSLVDEINLQSTIRLAERCKQAQVSRFILASSCAVYARSHGELLLETSVPSPITAYARAKLECEQLVARLADNTFAPTFVRLGTVYGVSPRMRFDTVVNDFVASAVANGRIDMRTEGRAWRPLIHVEDVARVFAAILTAPFDDVQSVVYNAATENARVIEIADAVTESFIDCPRTRKSGVFDERSYRVADTKLRRAFPSLPVRWSLETGIRQIRDALTMAGVTSAEWRSDRFRRIARLQGRLERGELDRSLRVRAHLAAR